MADILVELESLTGLISSLATSAEHMSSATDALKATSSSDLGSGDLDNAAQDFQHQWSYGIGKISGAAQEITDQLRSAKNTYETIEQEAKASLEQLAEAVGVSSRSSSSDGNTPGGATQPAESKIGRALAGGGQ